MFEMKNRDRTHLKKPENPPGGPLPAGPPFPKVFPPPLLPPPPPPASSAEGGINPAPTSNRISVMGIGKARHAAPLLTNSAGPVRGSRRAGGGGRAVAGGGRRSCE